MKYLKTINLNKGTIAAILLALALIVCSIANVENVPLLYFQSLVLLIIAGLNLRQADKIIDILPIVVAFFIVIVILILILQRAIVGQQGPYLHDSSALVEVAAENLLQGKNPYSMNLKNTNYGIQFANIAWGGVGAFPNPALEVFAYPPGIVILAIAEKLILMPIKIFYDFRILLMACFVVSVWLIKKLFKDYQVSPNKQIIAYVLIFLNPFIIEQLVGTNDIIPLTIFLLILYLMVHQRILSAALILSIGCTIKQSLWPLWPLFIFMTWSQVKPWHQRMAILALTIAPFLLITLPFYLWDPRSFINDVILYQDGKSSIIYPISGMGFSNILYQHGIPAGDRLSYFPYWVIQAIVSVLVFIGGVIKLWKNPTVKTLTLTYCLLLLAIWYFSRYFHHNHLWYIFSIFIIGWAIQAKLPIHKSVSTLD